MFDIGFAELLIIGVVGLLVIGPERLPETIRTASAWLNRLRRGFNDLKREVQQELHNDEVMRELRRTSEDVRQQANQLRDDLKSAAGEADPNLARPDPERTPAAGSRPGEDPGPEQRSERDDGAR
jgi:sec-independent protein translocase protein TatB